MNSIKPTHHEAVGVLRATGTYRLVAVRPIDPGEELFRIEGEETTQPTRYSVQIGDNLHIDLGSSYSAEEILDRYFWRFMNHSCEPNAEIRQRQVISSRSIEPWEAVTFNYNTTEWEMAEPFNCGCQSEQCLGEIQGLRYLTSAQRKQLGVVAPHLSRLEIGSSQLIGDASEA